MIILRAVYYDTGPYCMNVHFLLGEITTEERAESHFDLSEKINLTPSSILTRKEEYTGFCQA